MWKKESNPFGLSYIIYRTSPFNTYSPNTEDGCWNEIVVNAVGLPKRRLFFLLILLGVLSSFPMKHGVALQFCAKLKCWVATSSAFIRLFTASLHTTVSLLQRVFEQTKNMFLASIQTLASPPPVMP